MSSEQDPQKHETPAPRHRSDGAGSHGRDPSTSASEMEALRARIRSQSKTVAEHIAADAEAQAFLDDWAAPEALGD